MYMGRDWLSGWFSIYKLRLYFFLLKLVPVFGSSGLERKVNRGNVLFEKSLNEPTKS
jgi:hypothetical protein